MKKLAIVLMILSTSACTSKTQYGVCIGLNGDEQPNLKYQYSVWNIGMAMLFSSLILPPIFVALDEYKCPVGKK